MVNKARNGLENMRYRARRMNGSIQINSSHKKGTKVVVQLRAQ